jgi:hypothetical protein
MDKKICELKLDEVKAVTGGAYTVASLSTSYVKPTATLSAASQFIKPTATVSAYTFKV